MAFKRANSAGACGNTTPLSAYSVHSLNNHFNCNKYNLTIIKTIIKLVILWREHEQGGRSHEWALGPACVVFASSHCLPVNPLKGRF